MKVCCEHCRHEFEAVPEGGHRLLAGDSTDAAAVARLMQSERAVLVFTSPPYGSQRNYTTGGIADWDALMRGVFGVLPVTGAAQVLVNLGLVHRDNEWQPYWEGWLDWMSEQRWRRFGWYVWDQGPGLPGDWSGRFAPSFEFVFHFNREARKPNKIVECVWGGTETHLRKDGSSTALRKASGEVTEWSHAGTATQPFRIPDSVLRFMRHKARGIEVDHPAVFPVALPEFIISAYSNAGEIVYEPFAGSGTSIVAGERTGRRVMAIDIAPQYVDISIMRWQNFTGRTAVHADGYLFSREAAAAVA
jgi:DNA modification methylase